MSASDVLQLSHGVLALLMLAVGLFFHHALFGHVAQGRREALRQLIHLPVLALVLLFSLYWAATHLERLTFLVAPTELCLRFFALMVLFETALFPLAQVGRVGAAVTLGARVGFGVLAALLVALVAGIPLEDTYTQRALASTGLVYLLLHLAYSRVFKARSAGFPDVLRRRLRSLAYLLVLSLAGLYLLVAWQLLPVTRFFVQEYELGVVSLLGLMLGEALIALVFDYYFPVVRKSQVAHLYRDMMRAVLYLTMGLLVYSWSSGRALGLILADSAYFSVGIGLALKPTLGNFVAGLALRLSEPYEVGDFIQAGEVTGKVTHLSWRSTDVATLQGDIISLPNALLSRRMLVNHSRPARYHAVEHRFITDYIHPPNHVRRAALEALAQLDGVLSDPPPQVQLRQFGSDDIIWCLQFFIPDYGQRIEYEDKATQALWYVLHRQRYDLAGDSLNAIPRREKGRDLARELEELLKTVDFLAALEPAELQFLQRKARLQLFAAGENICEQGQPGNSFFIIMSGRLRVTARNAEGETFLSTEMQAGKYFGEMALLTGEPRSASVDAITDAEVFRLHKEDLRKLIQQNPAIEELISKALARRQLRTEKAREEAELLKAMSPEDAEQAESSLAEQFLAKMRNFFSY